MDATDKLKSSYDIVIAGGGPAGSSLAIRTAASGFSVLLVEQKKFPRDKLCGEFISPECLPHFDQLGVSDDIQAAGGTALTETVFYKRNGKGVAVRSEWFGGKGATALGLSRSAMDDVLLARASAVGVTVLQEATVKKLLLEDRRIVSVALADKARNVHEVGARLVVDATGRSRSVARLIGDKRADPTSAQHVAFKTHLRNASIANGVCEIYVYQGGYGGCNRVENGLYDLCFIASSRDVKRLGSSAERVMREVVFSNDRAAAALRDAEVAKPWLAVPIERFGRGKLIPADGIITVGDAAAFIDPFTGSGMLMALQSAKIAAIAIANSKLSSTLLAREYTREYSDAFDHRLKVCSMLRFAAFVPFLAEATISILAKSDNLREKLARATRHTSTQIS